MAGGAATVVTVGGFLLAVAVHTAIAVVGVRFLRVRLGTAWAPFVYAVVFIPIVYVPTTILFGGVLGAGGATVDPGTLFAVLFVLPLALGLSIDLFWLPAPEAVEVPATEE
ncbi:MAG: hypothetical protein ABEJ57_00415 [Halobacteriaceae archaeon]